MFTNYLKIKDVTYNSVGYVIYKPFFSSYVGTYNINNTIILKQDEFPPLWVKEFHAREYKSGFIDRLKLHFGIYNLIY